MAPGPVPAHKWEIYATETSETRSWPHDGRVRVRVGRIRRVDTQHYSQTGIGSIRARNRKGENDN
jgi:hypothetical protein